ncbi:hypothetical protein [Shewanella sp. 125m-1]
MESQQRINYNRGDAFNYFKVMNKLGAAFFILFLVGAFLPLVNLGGWSSENINLYTLAEPLILIILAVSGSLIYLTGISRLVGRVISFLFIALVFVWLFSQLYDIYDLAKTATEIRGRDFEWKYFARSFEEMIEALPIRGRDLVSPASICLSLAFIGIFACIFSPRYKENKQFKAAILGQVIDGDETRSTVEQTDKTSSLIVNIKSTLSLVISKIIALIKFVYQIVNPLVNTFLDKGTDIICKQQPNFKREQVKIVLFGVVLVLTLFIIF